MDLQSAQFGPQEMLPGTEGRNRYAVEQPGQTDRENATWRADSATRGSRRHSPRPVMDTWSGPDPHQYIMGHGDLAVNTGQFDQSGFVSERSEYEKSENDPIHPGAGPLKHIGAQSDTQRLYTNYGGRNKYSGIVQEHWDKQPVKMFRSDSPLHTLQSTDETEKGMSRNPEYAAAHSFMTEPEGRARINTIRAGIEQHGYDQDHPAWIAKVEGRHVVLDGHHRIVAAREAGLESFPARVWDMDAEKAALSKKVDQAKSDEVAARAKDYLKDRNPNRG